MQEITLQLPDRLVARLQRWADHSNLDVSFVAKELLTRVLQDIGERPVLEFDRGQREGAQNDPRLDWWREARGTHRDLQCQQGGTAQSYPSDGAGLGR